MKYFMRDMVGVPAPMVVVMRLMPWVWSKLKAVAHTLPYDAAVMNEFGPAGALRGDRVPALVMHGSKTDATAAEAARRSRAPSPARSIARSPADAQRQARGPRAGGRGVPRRQKEVTMRFIMHKTNAHWEAGAVRARS